MKVRHVIGIIILVLTLLFIGPMIMVAGIHVQEIPQHQTRWWFAPLLFGVPTAVLVLVGSLVVGPGHRIQAASWTLLAGAAYGGVLLLTLAPMMNSPEWGEMMANLQAQQGGRPTTTSLELARPLYLTALLALLGAGGLYLHHFVLKTDGAGDGHPIDFASVPPGDGRPLSISIISWFLLVSSMLGILSYALNVGNLDEHMAVTVDALGGPSVAAQKSLAIAMLAASGLCGAFMLRGANWARWLLVFAMLCGLVFNAVVYPRLNFAVPTLVWLAIYGYFLFYREPARRWFRPSTSGALDA